MYLDSFGERDFFKFIAIFTMVVSKCNNLRDTSSCLKEYIMKEKKKKKTIMNKSILTFYYLIIQLFIVES